MMIDEQYARRAGSRDDEEIQEWFKRYVNSLDIDKRGIEARLGRSEIGAKRSVSLKPDTESTPESGFDRAVDVLGMNLPGFTESLLGEAAQGFPGDMEQVILDTVMKVLSVPGHLVRQTAEWHFNRLNNGADLSGAQQALVEVLSIGADMTLGLDAAPGLVAGVVKGSRPVVKGIAKESFRLLADETGSIGRGTPEVISSIEKSILAEFGAGRGLFGSGFIFANGNTASTNVHNAMRTQHSLLGGDPFREVFGEGPNAVADYMRQSKAIRGIKIDVGEGSYGLELEILSRITREQHSTILKEAKSAEWVNIDTDSGSFTFEIPSQRLEFRKFLEDMKEAG